MILEDGKYYRLASGAVVRTELEKEAGLMAAYDPSGNRVHQEKRGDHVNGWEPISKNDWDAAVAKAKEEESEGGKKARKKQAVKPRERKGEERNETNSE